MGAARLGANNFFLSLIVVVIKGLRYAEGGSDKPPYAAMGRKKIRQNIYHHHSEDNIVVSSVCVFHCLSFCLSLSVCLSLCLINR